MHRSEQRGGLTTQCRLVRSSSRTRYCIRGRGRLGHLISSALPLFLYDLKADSRPSETILHSSIQSVSSGCHSSLQSFCLHSLSFTIREDVETAGNQRWTNDISPGNTAGSRSGCHREGLVPEDSTERVVHWFEVERRRGGNRRGGRTTQCPSH